MRGEFRHCTLWNASSRSLVAGREQAFKQQRMQQRFGFTFSTDCCSKWSVTCCKNWKGPPCSITFPMTLPMHEVRHALGRSGEGVKVVTKKSIDESQRTSEKVAIWFKRKVPTFGLLLEKCRICSAFWVEQSRTILPGWLMDWDEKISGLQLISNLERLSISLTISSAKMAMSIWCPVANAWRTAL